MSEALIELIVKIVFATFSALLSIAVAWITAKIAKNQNLKAIAAAKDELVNAAVETVGELQQTTVEALKEAATDHKLSGEDIKKLGQMLVEKVCAKMSAPATSVLEAAGVDIEEAIHSAAEAFIASMKADERA